MMAKGCFKELKQNTGSKEDNGNHYQQNASIAYYPFFPNPSSLSPTEPYTPSATLY